jgi:hypothetical protein
MSNSKKQNSQARAASALLPNYALAGPLRGQSFCVKRKRSVITALTICLSFD